MRKKLKFVFDRVLPIDCLGCGQEGGWVCEVCESELSFLLPIWQEAMVPLSGVVAVYSYDQKIVNNAVQVLKYQHADLVSTWMGHKIDLWLDEGGAGMFPPDAIIVPVPLHYRRRVKRGFNQSESIAWQLGRSLEQPVVNLLKRKKATQPQVSKTRLARIQNVENVFSLIKPRILISKCPTKSALIMRKPKWEPVKQTEITGRSIILVDDVTTTGATMASCARVLQEQGAKKIYGFAFAREL